jgi:hypothetical protein
LRLGGFLKGPFKRDPDAARGQPGRRTIPCRNAVSFVVHSQQFIGFIGGILALDKTTPGLMAIPSSQSIVHGNIDRKIYPYLRYFQSLV